MTVSVLLVLCAPVCALVLAARLVRAVRAAGRALRLGVGVCALTLAGLIGVGCWAAADALAGALGGWRFAVWAAAGWLGWFGLRAAVRGLFAR